MLRRSSIILLLLFFTYLFAKDQALIPVSSNSKLNFLAKARVTPNNIGEVQTAFIKNTEAGFWIYDNNLKAFVNNSIKTTIVYSAKTNFKRPLKLKIYSPDIQEGLSLEIYTDKIEPQRLIDKKGNFRYTDYFEGNLNQEVFVLGTEEKIFIDNIYSCTVELNLSFKVLMKHNVPSGKEIRIYYSLSEF